MHVYTACMVGPNEDGDVKRGYLIEDEDGWQRQSTAPPCTMQGIFAARGEIGRHGSDKVFLRCKRMELRWRFGACRVGLPRLASLPVDVTPRHYWPVTLLGSSRCTE